jgi:hypothetical protein
LWPGRLGYIANATNWVTGPPNKGMKLTKRGQLRSFAAYPQCSAHHPRAWSKASMSTVVATRGDFDARFPDLKGLPHGADRVPGRELANLVAKWLRQGRLAVERPEPKSPSGGVMTEERLYCPVCFKVGTAKQLLISSEYNIHSGRGRTSVQGRGDS